MYPHPPTPPSFYYASQVVSGIGYSSYLYKNVNDEIIFARITDLCETVTSFDQIAICLAIDLTLQQDKQLEHLNGAKIEKNLKKNLTVAVDDGLEGMLKTFLENNDTKAKVLGRLLAQCIINLLQKERMSFVIRAATRSEKC